VELDKNKINEEKLDLWSLWLLDFFLGDERAFVICFERRRKKYEEDPTEIYIYIFF
jgi:hypothetical protein